jgi:hypothetical protein
MSYTLKIRANGAFMHVTVEGDCTFENISGYLAEIQTICKERHCSRVLIEENLLGPDLNIIDVYTIVDKASPVAAQTMRQIAYVDVNPAHDMGISQFAETVAKNRGVNMKSFGSVRDAENWLNQNYMPTPNDVKLNPGTYQGNAYGE